MPENKKIKVFEDQMSYTHVVMAAIMYTFAICPFLYFGYLLYEYDFDINSTIRLLAYIITISSTFIVPAINISEENKVKVNLENKKLITEQKIILYNKTKIVEVDEFDYVAINNFGLGYTVTLWYQNNGYRHVKLISFYKKNKAFIYAKSLCKILDVDLLDKIDLKNPIWIDKSEI